MNSTEDHLALAREDLAIAESADSKREAYKRAAEHIAAYREATGDTWATIATALQCSERRVYQIEEWRKSGYEASTPFLMDQRATGRAAESHTKRVLREAEPEVVRRIVGELSPERQQVVAQAVDEVQRPVLPGTIGAMEAELGPLPSPPKSRLAAVLRIATEIDDLRERVEQHGIEDTDVMMLRQARRACEAAADGLLSINAAIAETLAERVVAGEES